MFETLCRAADGAHDGDRAIAAAERLVALDPTREDRHRVALQLCARHKGCDAALDRARLLVNLLRRELDVAPDATTRALIDAIRRGEIADARELLAAPPMPETVSPPRPPAPSADPAVPTVERAPSAPIPTKSRFWRGRPIAAAAAMVAALTVGAAVLAWEAGSHFRFGLTDRPDDAAALKARAQAKHALAGLVVLPFTADSPGGADDSAFARRLTHNLMGNLARFGDLRIISERTSDLYRDRQVDVAKVGAELGVAYAIIGHVQGTDDGPQVTVQLVDTTTRLNLWSHQLQRASGNPARIADDISRGLARILVINLAYSEARRLRSDPDHPVDVAGLLLRGRVAEMRGYLRDNVSEALKLYEEALRRAPRNQVAMLGVSRMLIVATTNFLDVDPAPDIARAERLLDEVLVRSPNSAMVHFNLGLLQKYRRQFAASLQSFQRSIDLNPSFLPAQAQIGAVLTRMGQPDKGLETIQATMRAATANDPAMGYWYLFSAEAELELGHEQAALDWMLRANTLMPGSPLVQAWLASVYTTRRPAERREIRRAVADHGAGRHPALVHRPAGRQRQPGSRMAANADPGRTASRSRRIARSRHAASPGSPSTARLPPAQT